MPPRVVVYLGASQPVHGTHTRMVRTLLDASFDRVFIFLLRWKPERYGITADSAAETLRVWLSKLPPADFERVVLQVVQHDHEGGSQMRANLGPDAQPEVEVCFSRKYDNDKFRDRIKTDWLPIYAKEFTCVNPRFLADETDPGGSTPAGTPAFSTALGQYRAARTLAGPGAPETDESLQALDAWRPEGESAASWLAYIDSLFSGTNGDPFYTTEEKEELEYLFFSDPDVIDVLLKGGEVSPACWNKLPDKPAAFLQEKSNRGTFWKTYAGPAEEHLWRCFCLKRQLGTAMPARNPTEILTAFKAYFDTPIVK